MVPRGSPARCSPGVVIGLLIGLLVARLGIPSFVVTLAWFLGLQGVLLLVIGEGGTIRVDDSVIVAIMNNNLTPPAGLGALRPGRRRVRRA